MNLFKQSQDLSPSQSVHDELETQREALIQKILTEYYRSFTLKCVGSGLCFEDSVTDLYLN